MIWILQSGYFGWNEAECYLTTAISSCRSKDACHSAANLPLVRSMWCMIGSNMAWCPPRKLRRLLPLLQVRLLRPSRFSSSSQTRFAHSSRRLMHVRSRQFQTLTLVDFCHDISWLRFARASIEVRTASHRSLAETRLRVIELSCMASPPILHLQPIERLLSIREINICAPKATSLIETKLCCYGADVLFSISKSELSLPCCTSVVNHDLRF